MQPLGQYVPTLGHNPSTDAAANLEYGKPIILHYWVYTLGASSVQCIVFSAQYTVKCRINTEQCTVYSVQFTVYSVQCTVYTVQCTVYTVQCTLYSVHLSVPVQCSAPSRVCIGAPPCRQYVLHILPMDCLARRLATLLVVSSLECAVRRAQCTAYSVQRTVYSVQCAVCSVPCKMCVVCSLQCAV